MSRLASLLQYLFLGFNCFYCNTCTCCLCTNTNADNKMADFSELLMYC